MGYGPAPGFGYVAGGSPHAFEWSGYGSVSSGAVVEGAIVEGGGDGDGESASASRDGDAGGFVCGLLGCWVGMLRSGWWNVEFWRFVCDDASVCVVDVDCRIGAAGMVWFAEAVWFRLIW